MMYSDKEYNVYRDKVIEQKVFDDEIDPEESAFLKGYLQA